MLLVYSIEVLLPTANKLTYRVV